MAVSMYGAAIAGAMVFSWVVMSIFTVWGSMVMFSDLYGGWTFTVVGGSSIGISIFPRIVFRDMFTFWGGILTVNSCSWIGMEMFCLGIGIS